MAAIESIWVRTDDALENAKLVSRHELETSVFGMGHSMSNEQKKWKSQPTISDYPQI